MTSSSCFEPKKSSYFSFKSSFGANKPDFNGQKRVALAEINSNVIPIENSIQKFPPSEQMFSSHFQPKFQGFQFKPTNKNYFDEPQFTDQNVMDEADDWPDIF